MGDNNKFQYRFLSRVVFEAETPLAVGSGDKNIITDALVARDVNGLPYIPGTSIAGVVRSMLDTEDANAFFGFSDLGGGEGSKIIFSEAKLLDSMGMPVDGIRENILDDELLNVYQNLPIRQHVRINAKGSTDKTGKFDEEVVFAGSRFCFEMEILACNEADENQLDLVLSKLYDSSIRIGSGSRSGFGKIKVVDVKRRFVNLANSFDRTLYLEKSSDLSVLWEGWKTIDIQEKQLNKNWKTIALSLQPEDFFLFGSGFGDGEADITPVMQRVVEWAEGGKKGKISPRYVLIPASSIKGAIAHRVAYYWNKENNLFVGNPDAKVGSENEAVKALFGSNDTNDIARGNVLFSDVIVKDKMNDKVLNHIAIDRFTGGAIDGALFQEKVLYGGKIELEILVNASVDDKYVSVFYRALDDIRNGSLPLGGGVNRGNGIFKEIIK